MSFASGCTPVSFDKLFEVSSGDKVSRENWGMIARPEPQHDSLKRRNTTSSIAKKKAKMTRGDEQITDETARKAATQLLDQIQDTPGRISLNFETPEAASVCPIPTSLNQIVNTKWTVNQLQEGQLTMLLAQDANKFKSLGVKNIKKGSVETQILPRQMDVKEIVEKLKKQDNDSDQFVGYAAAVANVLRRCDAETAQKITQAITATIEKEAPSIVNC
ncbi:Adr-2-binding protein 1 [Caenorhabditis elegans]|uniref:Adr-2-binding protein 1 n=1 Tax=Caenorhabditis elegans TaxID=6239 RepID=ADBP1_CAEEL|nr:Adr-2-binding protein 1 [Caenorhabditis elegans]G5EDW1.1 RecName: Full=Adr-2-binding protein 1 [Caenorhabditis elegans]AAG50214.1 2L737 [Caenorhabditis elegans]CAA20335.2 Adr-2-binding protein 1 [Caenorhabditis elegans]|eukprot:NP_496439.1 Adr-2-binding protein 1 [Caenorhabditis elegans]